MSVASMYASRIKDSVSSYALYVLISVLVSETV